MRPRFTLVGLGVASHVREKGKATPRIRQVVTELRDMHPDNSLSHITGIWCYLLADCTSPHYNREQHGPCVDNCELFYTQNPSNCRQRLCKHDHSGNYQNQFTGMCKASNPFYCPDDFQPTLRSESRSVF